MKLLASTVAEISRGSHIFWMLPRPDPTSFGLKSSFGQLLPKLKLYTKLEVVRFLSLTEISGSQNFRGAPLAQTPAKFGRKSCLWQHTPQIQVVCQI